MAKKAGITDVYARYGKAHNKEEYELLRAVTHWSDEHVEEEKKLVETEIHPTYVLDGGFSQLLALFHFSKYTGPLASLFRKIDYRMLSKSGKQQLMFRGTLTILKLESGVLPFLRSLPPSAQRL